MFDKFGEMSSAKEINELAVNMRAEGEIGLVLALAKENGLDLEIAEVFLAGGIDFICDEMGAAIGKIDMECKELQPKELMADWVEYIKARCFEDIHMAEAVRKKGKKLAGCIAKLMLYALKNQIDVNESVIKEAGMKNKNQRITFGVPGMGTAKKIITEYYMG